MAAHLLGRNRLSDMNTLADDTTIQWDGRVHSYRPGSGWRDRASAIAFHDEVATDLDPVTYEVLRNRLWNINISHGETLARISGSPIFQALDFNMCVLTEDAELVMNAPFILFLASGAPMGARYVMEHFAEGPGIHEGDMYLVSDPWISATHQMDVMILCPVFADGRLFAWVSNAGHQYDLGGIVPGGWPQNAPDVFSDPIVFSPMKIVERGVLRPDLDAMYCRQSRMPDLVALDLRAQISGCRYAMHALHDLCNEFGASIVKAVMRRILDDAQESFRQKLRRVPDGTYSELIWVDERMPGDRENYRIQLNVHKKGDRLVIDNIGTDSQVVGPVGYTYASFAGSIMGAISITFLWEHLFSLGGATRQIDMAPAPGLLSCADYPAAVAGGVTNAAAQVQAMLAIINRMLACDPELKRDIVGTQYTCPVLVVVGSDDEGRQFGTAFTDVCAVGSAGRPDRDGVDTGGANWSPLMRLLNVETMEQLYPVVYLYRRERPGGGGAGTHRGGTGIDLAFVPYRAEQLTVVTNSGASTVSTHGANGTFGGYPSPTVCFHLMKRTDVRESFARRFLPANATELATDTDTLLRGKSDGTPMGNADVMEYRIPGGGGYGDPLARDPDLVSNDVFAGLVTRQDAELTYGVIFEDDGTTIDGAATEDRRATELDQRGQWPLSRAYWSLDQARDLTPATGEPMRHVHEYLTALDRDGHRVLSCDRCGETIAAYGENYKYGLLVDERPVPEVVAGVDPDRFLNRRMVVRRYCCPGCHILMATEITRQDEPPFADMILKRTPG